MSLRSLVFAAGLVLAAPSLAQDSGEGTGDSGVSTDEAANNAAASAGEEGGVSCNSASGAAWMLLPALLLIPSRRDQE